MSQTVTGAPATSAAAAAHHPAAMSHRQILEALSGLLLGMFVAILSSTVVSTALPIIVADLGGTESGYTWVVTAALLATTISTPIWGKLADLFSKKVLVQIALVIFLAASAVAGLSQTMAMLITTRVFQGIGAGGLMALAQVVMATMIAPRERGKYSGYLGATFALATVGGPLVGGALTEHLSWHWCFYVGIPFAVLAFAVLQKTLHLPVLKRVVHIDYLGATLLAAGVASLLLWVSLAGQQFDWWSWQTWLMVGGGLALLLLAILAEHQAPEPIIPLRFFRNRTVVLASLASLFVGVAMFGATIFLSQYFQLARGETPTRSGVLTIPLIAGLFLSSTIVGQIITRTGRWKVFVVLGGVLLTAGIAPMATVAYDTDYWIIAPYMFLIGAGVGMMMQNLVLAVQNIVVAEDLGAASSFVAFTRSLGGAIGVSALGAVLAHRVRHYLEEGFSQAGIDPRSSLGGGSGIPDLSALPGPIRTIVQSAYGSAIADIFLAAAPFALTAFLVTLFLKEVRLRGRQPTAVVAEDDEILDNQRWNSPEDHPTHAAPVDTDGSGAAVSARRAAVTGGGRLTGTVAAASDGRGVREATITLVDADGQVVASTTTDENGDYLLDDLNAGRYTLTASGYAPVAVQVDVDEDAVSALRVTLGAATDTARWVGWWHQVTGPSPLDSMHGPKV